MKRLRGVGRLVLLAGLVGAVAGLGAAAFQLLAGAVTAFGLEWMAGYQPGRPAGEAHFFGTPEPLAGGFSPWLLLAVITAGGLVSGLVVYALAPEADGHGTDAVIRAFHRGRGLIRARVPFVKLVCSAVTIGTGGSGGREGPIAQIGAGFGSFLARAWRLSDRERRIMLAAGMGAGVAAIFRAPLAGAVFAAEVLYRDLDFEAEVLVPSFISCTSAYCVFGLIVEAVLGEGAGFCHVFSLRPGLAFDRPLLLAPLAALALVLAGAAWLYVRAFYGVHDAARRLPVPPHVRPALGALATGLLALAALWLARRISGGDGREALSVLSFGYGVLQDVFAGSPSGRDAAAAAGVLLVVGLGKIATTSLTIGSGGSGGVFGPSMVIGGAIGGATGIVFHAAMPGVVTRPEVFAILGMAGFFSAAAKTPASTIIIVSELTGGYELLLPAIWVSTLAYLVSGSRTTIYREQVPTRLDSPAHGGEFVRDVLQGLTLRDGAVAPSTDFVAVPAGMPLDEIADLFARTEQAVFPVVDEGRRLLGVFDAADVRRLLGEREAGRVIVAEDIMAEGVQPALPDSDLSALLERFARMRYEELPVVDPATMRVTGMVGRNALVRLHADRLAEARDPERGTRNAT